MESQAAKLGFFPKPKNPRTCQNSSPWAGAGRPQNITKRKQKKKPSWGSLKTNIGRAEILTKTRCLFLHVVIFIRELVNWFFGANCYDSKLDLFEEHDCTANSSCFQDIFIRGAWEFVAGAKIGVVLTCATATPDINWHQALFFCDHVFMAWIYRPSRMPVTNEGLV